MVHIASHWATAEVGYSYRAVDRLSRGWIDPVVLSTGVFGGDRRERGRTYIHISLSIYVYIYIYTHRERGVCDVYTVALSLSLYIYIYIYIHIICCMFLLVFHCTEAILARSGAIALGLLGLAIAAFCFLWLNGASTNAPSSLDST